MELLNPLLGFLPENFKLPFLGFVFVLFYAVPYGRDYFGRRSLWTETKHNLEILKLIYETEALEPGDQLGNLKVAIQAQIAESTALFAKPHEPGLPKLKKFVYALLGGLLFVLPIAALDWARTDASLDEIGTGVLGAFVLASLSALITMLYRTRNRLLLGVAGGVTTFMVALAIGLLAGGAD